MLEMQALGAAPLDELQLSAARAFFASSNHLVHAVDENVFFAGLPVLGAACAEVENRADASMLDDISASDSEAQINRAALAKQIGISACSSALLALGFRLQARCLNYTTRAV